MNLLDTDSKANTLTIFKEIRQTWKWLKGIENYFKNSERIKFVR